MGDVTRVFQNYRISARSIWNLFFWPDPDLANWDTRDLFENIKERLFEALILAKLSLDKGEARFAVVPRARDGVPAHIQQTRDDDRNRYWDHPVTVLKPSEVELEFLDYFDWDLIGCLDFKYVRTRIKASQTHSDLVGREALLDAEHVDIFLEEERSA